jgi:hypothetical protein
MDTQAENHFKNVLSRILVAHAYKSYLGDRAQEDHSLKPAQANSLPDPISKKLNIRQGCLRGEHLHIKCEALSSNLSTIKKKKKERWVTFGTHLGHYSS